MSDTIVDMPKVAQMLDAGWEVRVFKGLMGSYEVRARHPDDKRMKATKDALIKTMSKNTSFLDECGVTAEEAVEDFDFANDALMTDDFTPEQALTRMAYKTFGEIL